MSKPPVPSSSSRARVLTITSSPSATGPVSRGYATHGRPSTSSRDRPSTRSTTAVIRPRLSVSISSGIDQRKRYFHHPLEVCHGDALVGRVNVLHAVRQVETRQSPLVEDVRVGCAAAEPVRRLVAALFERRVSDPHDGIVRLEAIALVALRHLRLDLAGLEPRRKGENVDHFLHQLIELAFVV